MRDLTRRDFLKTFGAAIAGSIAALNVPASVLFPQRPYYVLAAGDSLIWGQGLLENDKMYTLTTEWLRSQVFHDRQVELMVKAHSGATLKFHPDEAKKYGAAGCDETYYHEPEVNIGFPSIQKQIEVATEEYREAGAPGADLIIMTGGITDISTPVVYDPKGDDDKLRADVRKYCFEDMSDVLDLAASRNPNALIAVVGYFPAISEYSKGSKLFNAWLEVLGKSSFEKALVNNPIVRPLFFSKLKKRAIRRSEIWIEESDRNLKAAVKRLNDKYQTTRAVFVKCPLTARDAAEAPNTKLFRMGKDGMVSDAVSASRIEACNKALPELKRTTGIDYPVRSCEVAAIGHPDPAGARAYADAIITTLAPALTSGALGANSNQ